MYDYTYRQMKEKLKIYRRYGCINYQQYRALLKIAKRNTTAAEKALEDLINGRSA